MNEFKKLVKLNIELNDFIDNNLKEIKNDILVISNWKVHKVPNSKIVPVNDEDLLHLTPESFKQDFINQCKQRLNEKHVLVFEFKYYYILPFVAWTKIYADDSGYNLCLSDKELREEYN